MRVELEARLLCGTDVHWKPTRTPDLRMKATERGVIAFRMPMMLHPAENEVHVRFIPFFESRRFFVYVLPRATFLSQLGAVFLVPGVILQEVAQHLVHWVCLVAGYFICFSLLSYCA